MFLVTGATGNVGSGLVRQLAEAGADVRALVRDPNRAVFPPSVQIAAGDLDRPESLADALSGVEAVFLLTGFGDLKGTLDQARTAGVERVVVVSGASAVTGDTSNVISRYKIHDEQTVRDSGLAWTFLRPGPFMSNACRWLPQLAAGDTVRTPFPETRGAVVDPYDIATVAAKVLLTGGHDGLAHRLSGPEALLPAEQVAILGAALGRDLQAVGLTDAESKQEMAAAGMPAEAIEGFFKFAVGGTFDESVVVPEMPALLGRPPRTFAQWAQEHAGAFR